jgi:hypothetical protein
VLLAPELAPGSVGLGGCAGTGSGAGVEVPGMLVPGSSPVGLRAGTPVVLGAWLDVLALGVAPRLPPGDPAPAGATPGAVPPAGGGGPASGWLCGGGIFVLLIESPTGLGAEPGCVLSDGFIMRGVGLASFMSGALAPNGLRWSSAPCASSVPFHLGCSGARRSTIRTSAGGATCSAADASLTTTGCKKNMVHLP